MDGDEIMAKICSGELKVVAARHFELEAKVESLEDSMDRRLSKIIESGTDQDFPK